MTTHELKCQLGPYDEIASGLKTFEFRKDDRGYFVNDLLNLRRYNPDMRDAISVDDMYTGESMTVKVTSILRNGHGMPEGFVCMSIAALASSTQPASEATAEQVEALDDLVTLVRRLVHALEKAAPGNAMRNIATDYLERLGFNKGPFRSASSTPEQPGAVVQEPFAWAWECLPDSPIFKRKGEKSGVYFENPFDLGIPKDHPAYKWTQLYTHPPTVGEATPPLAGDVSRTSAISDAATYVHSLLWNAHPECCGQPSVGATYMGQNEMVCCDRPNHDTLSDEEIVKRLRTEFPESSPIAAMAAGGVR